MFSGQSFLHRLSVVLGSGPDRTTSHFLIKTTLISFLAHYTECSLTKLFLYSRSLHYYFFTSILHFINIYCSRVAVCRPIVLSTKRIYQCVMPLSGILVGFCVMISLSFLQHWCCSALFQRKTVDTFLSLSSTAMAMIGHFYSAVEGLPHRSVIDYCSVTLATGTLVVAARYRRKGTPSQRHSRCVT